MDITDGGSIAGPSNLTLEERSTDLEFMSIPSVVGREAGERDPLLLRSKLVSHEDIDGLKHRKKGKKLANFYQNQNDHITTVLKPLDILSAEGEQDIKDNALKVRIAINVSFAANIVLAGLQLYAAISSLSLALFASCIDAVFDPLANLILWLAHRASKNAEEKKWPASGSRFETIYGSIMGGVNVILIVESIQEFITHSGDELQQFHLPSIIAVGIAFVTKLALFLYCYAIRSSSSQVQVLWEDHRNDLLTNGFGILTAAGGAKLAWWIDPMGATIIAVCIIAVWTRTVYEQFTFLGGITAPPEYQNLVTYQAMTFSSDIQKIDTIRVYHWGPRYIVEIDIVLDPHIPLWRAHDISQELQDKIEALPDVDRCFVHVDHEVEHKPEHRKRV
ncbi:hypothetical protein TREMEDRAFT_66707 [Tremella mesenterica DSM 1558]|uniref:uncharacterized protein n=1 Tax=Tremella mesenterica (strain ATCC 24925 / CBS 8224 / DSM 1558 / NBRC 9311 / NRRL Y-6157 / RJB 2259-6 / UBC 559-6) TaxID=578456 RepID=UPI0003F49FF9|nr:uncharacterized protein TREMEDRAFT_66707 [Tremella mesenterica DSM 1558]EIW72087.1 hypothetical protein TREMEDRAFT_66707 [Tremella mesenterica DSM 1558]